MPSPSQSPPLLPTGSCGPWLPVMTAPLTTSAELLEPPPVPVALAVLPRLLVWVEAKELPEVIFCTELRSWWMEVGTSRNFFHVSDAVFVPSPQPLDRGPSPSIPCGG